MAKLKCYECGAIFDEDDAETRRECVGEFWGSPAYESYSICPVCHSDDLEEYEESEEEDDETE